MAGRKKMNSNTLRGNLKRANTQLLLSSVMLFQFVAMLLLSLKHSPFDLQALAFSIVLPIVTYAFSMGISRIWPVDRTLLILVLLLCSVSIVTLQDISRAAITPLTQALHMCAGLVAMCCGIMFIRWVRSWEKWIIPLMGLAAILLLLPLLFGQWQNGAKNWIGFTRGPLSWLSFQPSEFAKLALIVLLAAAFEGQPRFKHCLPYLMFVALLCMLLLVERDLGALLLYFLTTVAIYFAATSNAVVSLFGLGMGAGAAFVAYQMFPYVQRRIEMFQNPWSDPLIYGYQLIQALIAIGSGGAFGMGLGLGYPRNIPLYHSDFVFASIAEEFGLIFSLGLLCVYLIIIVRGLIIAMNARSSFHALVTFGVIALLGFQTIIIVGGNIKLLPLTGVTLPLISAGGSSIISMMGMIGLLLGVSSLNANDEVADLERMTVLEEGA